MIGLAAARSDATDEMLMVRYQRGDREAFAELVRRYQRPVYNFVIRQVRHPGTAEDVTQEVLVRVVQNAAEFKHEARFTTWLYTIARNLCIDHLRKQSHRRHPSLDQPAAGASEGRPLGDNIADAHPSTDVERAAAASEVQACIVRAVEGLPEEQREVFLLREVANLPFKEIAEVTGAGENTVKSRMRYALETLRGHLQHYKDFSFDADESADAHHAS